MFEKITSAAIGALMFFYGIYCALMPSQVAASIGYGLTNGEAQLELIAMYGTVEIAIGLFGLIAAFNTDYLKPALLLFSITFVLLFITRMAGYALFEDLGDYTQKAAIFELLCAIFSTIGFKRLSTSTP